MYHFILSRKSYARSSQALRVQLRVEELEARTVLTVFTPAQITHAYAFDNVSFGGVKGDGSGQTIAIVDAYNAPKLTTDLAYFDNYFGLPAADLTVAYAQGSKPANNTGWAQETTLDVEWAHAIAPGAKILLVEAANSSFTNLFGAVDYARKQAGVVVVSMSWGGGEFNGEAAYDSYFTTPTGHLGGTNGSVGAPNLAGGVTFVASSGDTGAVTEYPAVSPNVLGVGGTSIVTADSTGTYKSETGWSDTGGGISSFESKPSYQSSVTQSSTKRTSPDVAYDADPNTGVYVYFQGGWYAFGGTSIGAPQWAALIAITDQGRAIGGQGALDSSSQTLPAIYNLSSSDFHDITKGSAGARRNSLNAGPGYDLVTGRGSPIANLVIQQLVTTTATGTVTAHLQGGGSGGGSAGATTIQGSPVASTPISPNLAGPIAAALAASRNLPVVSFQPAPASNSALPNPTRSLDALGQSTASSPATRITTAVFIGGFGSNIAGDDADESSDDWDMGMGRLLDAMPLDTGTDADVGEASSGSDE